MERWVRHEPKPIKTLERSSPKLEALYWVISFTFAVASVVFWRGEGYWIWKSYGDLVWAVMMMVPLISCLLPLLLIALLFAVWKKRRTTELLRTIQCLLPIAALGIALCSSDSTEDRFKDFTRYRLEREALALTLKSRPYDSKQRGRPIPIQTPHLAAENRVYVYGEGGEFMVWFPILLWGIDNHSGFVYSQTGNEPPQKSFLDTVSVERLDDHWFWIGTT